MKVESFNKGTKVCTQLNIFTYLSLSLSLSHSKSSPLIALDVNLCTPLSLFSLKINLNQDPPHSIFSQIRATLSKYEFLPVLLFVTSLNYEE